MYVSLSRARERTDVYISREDLGEQGMNTGAIERLGERMARSRAQKATITKEVAEPSAEPEPTTEHPAQIEPATQALPERIVDPAEPNLSAEPAQQHEPPDQAADHPERQHSTEPPQQHGPPTRTAEPRVQDSGEIPSSSNTTQGTESEIQEVLKARQARQFEWQRDRRGPQRQRQRTGTGSRGDRAPRLRNYAGTEQARQRSPRRSPSRPRAARLPLERNTQAQREHERHIDKAPGVLGARHRPRPRQRPRVRHRVGESLSSTN